MANRELYKVTMEIIAPMEITLKVWAESPEEAAEIANLKHLAGPPKPVFSKMRKIKAKVYKWLQSRVLYNKKY